MSSPEVARHLVTRFFASLYERFDLQEHFACYHPEAWVLLGNSVMRAGDLDPVGYETMLGGLMTMASLRPGKPTIFELAGEGSWSGDEHEGLLIQPMREVKGGHAFTAAFHLATHEGAWRYLGVTVPGEGQPDLATLRVAVAAELAQASLLVEPGELLVTPMDLAYRRASGAGEPLLVLDGEHFTCQDSGHCCRTEWGLHLPATALKVLEAVDWSPHILPAELPLFEPASPHAAHPFRVRRQDHGCPFHRDGHCVVHAAAGFNPLPTCATFPVGFTATPAGVAVWTSFSCPSVRHNLGQALGDRLDDMRARHAAVRQNLDRVPELVTLVGETEVPYGHYQAFEAGALEVLAIDSLSMVERVRCVAGAVQAWAADPTLAPDVLRGLAMASQPVSGSPACTPDGFEALGLATYLVLSKNLPQVFEGPLAELDDVAKLSLPARLVAAGLTYAPDPVMLTRYLRQVLFRKRTLTSVGIVGHVHWLVWLEAIIRYGALAQALAAGRQEHTPEEFEQALVAVEYAGFQSSLLTSGVLGSDELRQLLLTPAGAIAR